MPVKVLILGAGPPPAGFDVPVWLVEQRGAMLVERFAQVCQGLDADLIFAVRSTDVRRFHIDNIISLAAPGATIVPVTGETQGAACSALLCIRHIGPDDELLILSSNEILDIDYAAALRSFRARGLDAGIVTFPSLHPRYSFVHLDEHGFIDEASEKRPISRHATAGFYWFRRGADFIAGAQDMIRKDAHVDGHFYVSLVYNELVLKQRRMGIEEIDAKHYHPLKSRRQVDLYEAEGAGEAA